MKKILITIHSDSELISYEAVSLACTLATFDHAVSVVFTENSKTILTNPKSRVYGMVQSFELYDIQHAWHEFASDEGLDSAIITALSKKPEPSSPDKANDFDAVFEF